MRTKIIYEDKDIIVCHKPSGIAVQSAGIGSIDMVSELKNYLNLSGQNPSKTSKNKEPYLGIVHRLDQPVEGVMVFAKTPKAAASLSGQAEGSLSGGMTKIYQAEVFGHLQEQSGELRNYLIKDGKTNTSKAVEEADIVSNKELEIPEPIPLVNSQGKFDNGSPNVSRKKSAKFIKNKNPYKLAVLHYKVIEQKKETDILRIQLHTGRHHQIRVQFSHAGYPLIGDTKYASEASAAYNKENNIREIALKAVQLEFTHPSSGEKMVFSI